MRSVILTLLLLAIISLSRSELRDRQRANIAPNLTDRPAIGRTDFERSRKSPDNEKRVRRLQSRNQTGSDGEVRKIHLDSEEDKPGIRAYGLPRNRLQDNGVIERVYMGEDRFNEAPKSGRLVEAYGMPKDNVATNGFIERLPSAAAVNRQPARLGSSEEIAARARRSVREGVANKVEENVASEAEDMQAQDSKIFRPLFVYRHQQAARQKRKHSRNLTHRFHRHPSHHYCDHRLVR
ncbi:PREDICTED: uncharacterized protein LOC106742088 [Dinoponera quadriceps]|uniref:Uncharacterized protein LOC106742088 n=1 Tax=Dinoponera quadriceps TaxID=609295 RepID=A0A6P3WVT4_DINQU|nr:PREDICTED: uncharacterized protein LOC106742088 [Dinoponera quadriceps]